MKGIAAFLTFLLCFVAMFSGIIKMCYAVHLDGFCLDVADDDTSFTVDLCSKDFFRIYFRTHVLLAGDVTIGKFILISLHSDLS